MFLFLIAYIETKVNDSINGYSTNRSYIQQYIKVIMIEQSVATVSLIPINTGQKILMRMTDCRQYI